MAYSTAQVCPSGHVANKYFGDLPDYNHDYCETCGQKTLTACPNCDKPIRGAEDGIGPSSYSPPAYCQYCGQPFPWTQARLQAAHELARELDTISNTDREILERSIDELVADTPATPVAATRFKKIMTTVSREAVAAFREILVDVVSETAKKLMWPGL